MVETYDHVASKATKRDIVGIGFTFLVGFRHSCFGIGNGPLWCGLRPVKATCLQLVDELAWCRCVFIDPVPVGI